MATGKDYRVTSILKQFLSKYELEFFVSRLGYVILAGMSPRRQSQINRAVEIIREGGIVVFPTDTVYGLGADPLNERAVARIYDVKGRAPGMALPLLASGVRQVSEIAVMTPLSRTIAKRFWPGALTLVVKRSSTFPDFVCAGKETIAVRVPAHNVPRAMARALGVPVIGTSANLSGAPSARSVQEAAIQLGKLVDLIIDGGDCTGGIESTIVDVTGAKPVILREGAIREEEIIRSLRNEKKGRLE